MEIQPHVEDRLGAKRGPCVAVERAAESRHLERANRHGLPTVSRVDGEVAVGDILRHAGGRSHHRGHRRCGSRTPDRALDRQLIEMVGRRLGLGIGGQLGRLHHVGTEVIARAYRLNRLRVDCQPGVARAEVESQRTSHGALACHLDVAAQSAHDRALPRWRNRHGRQRHDAIDLGLLLHDLDQGVNLGLARGVVLAERDQHLAHRGEVEAIAVHSRAQVLAELNLASLEIEVAEHERRGLDFNLRPGHAVLSRPGRGDPKRHARRLVEHAGVYDLVAAQVGREVKRDRLGIAVYLDAGRDGIGELELRRQRLRDLRHRLELGHRNRPDVQTECHRYCGRIDHAVGYQRPDLAGQRKIFLRAQRSETQLDVDRRADAEVLDVQVDRAHRDRRSARVLVDDRPIVDRQARDRHTAERSRTRRRLSRGLCLGKRRAFKRRRPGRRRRRGRRGSHLLASGGFLPDAADVQLAALIADDMHHGLLERYLLDLDAMAQQGHQRDPRVNVGGLHERRLGETGVVRDRDAAKIGDHAPSEARVDVLDVDLAPDRVAGLAQDEAALLLDDPVEVEHCVDHHRDHGHDDHSNYNYCCPDELAHHDILSRPWRDFILHRSGRL